MAIDDQHLATAKCLLELGAMLHRLGPHDALLQAIGVDAGGTDLHPDAPAVVIDGERALVRLVIEAEGAGGARQKVTRVVKGVESHDVGVEETAEDQIAVGEGAEYLGGGEGGVKEVSASHGVVALAKERGEEHEVVVVDPHKVAVRVEHLHHLVREALVGGEVTLPVGLAVSCGGLRGHG